MIRIAGNERTRLGNARIGVELLDRPDYFALFRDSDKYSVEFAAASIREDSRGFRPMFLASFLAWRKARGCRAASEKSTLDDFRRTCEARARLSRHLRIRNWRSDTDNRRNGAARGE